ncbi:MAG: SGNH hydrolase domain-containing protein, partial [Actinomycetota bacterium]
EGGDCQSPNTQSTRQTFFLESLSQSLNQILIRGGNVLFVGATPVMHREQDEMESEGDLRGTALSLSRAIVGASDDFRQDLSRTAPPGRVAFIDLHRLLCADDLCPFSRGDELLFTTAGSANDHLSVQGAQQIQDEILRQITRLLD